MGPLKPVHVLPLPALPLSLSRTGVTMFRRLFATLVVPAVAVLAFASVGEEPSGRGGDSGSSLVTSLDRPMRDVPLCC
ncbi:hypothetical protein Sxan_39690 [Streptomyces xanthophaeus]|uniref:Uncharacterized protein n=2 Tax=Streptomyces xanthophaeus TaxID=67385 RepID=A0A919GXW5_9ACTN|nr:hypothetical protein KPP03845_105841 [Streptomyces xanthophaeus]GHI86605.1 hypothetical protein Sxan_39690 [Streptomyces xanthophaeus]